jgi:hypothetical protein
VFKHQTSASLSEITPLEKNFSKPPMKKLLEDLGQYVDVSQEFKRKLANLIERRHILIHRWGIEYGLPDEAEGFLKITVFSNELAKDANGLTKVLYRYIVEWMSKFPAFHKQFAEDHTKWSIAIPKELREYKVERAN